MLFGLVLVEVGAAAAQSVLLVHEQHGADGALRLQVHVVHQAHRLHHHGHARAVVDRAGAEVPGVEVRADEDDLIGLLAAAELRHDVR